jgi:hypothetical protein
MAKDQETTTFTIPVDPEDKKLAISAKRKAQYAERATRGKPNSPKKGKQRQAIRQIAKVAAGVLDNKKTVPVNTAGGFNLSGKPKKQQTSSGPKKSVSSRKRYSMSSLGPAMDIVKGRSRTKPTPAPEPAPKKKSRSVQVPVRLNHADLESHLSKVLSDPMGHTNESSSIYATARQHLNAASEIVAPYLKSGKVIPERKQLAAQNHLYNARHLTNHAHDVGRNVLNALHTVQHNDGVRVASTGDIGGGMRPLNHKESNQLRSAYDVHHRRNSVNRDELHMDIDNLHHAFNNHVNPPKPPNAIQKLGKGLRKIGSKIKTDLDDAKHEIGYAIRKKPFSSPLSQIGSQIGKTVNMFNPWKEDRESRHDIDLIKEIVMEMRMKSAKNQTAQNLGGSRNDMSTGMRKRRISGKKTPSSLVTHSHG